MCAVPRQRRLQEASGISEVHGLSQARSAQRPVFQAERRRGVCFVPYRPGMEAFDLHGEGTRCERVSVEGEARATGMRPSATFRRARTLCSRSSSSAAPTVMPTSMRDSLSAAPYFNSCDRCHNLEAYKPSTFSLAKHKETHFALTGGHIAVPCADCHKESAEFQPKPAVIYHWKILDCTYCHNDPHKGQFKERMQQDGLTATLAGARRATTRSRGKNCRASTIRRRNLRFSAHTGRQRASIATSHRTSKPS